MTTIFRRIGSGSSEVSPEAIDWAALGHVTDDDIALADD